jgi:EmrB/QacA subfamily drug resistance transporter
MFLRVFPSIVLPMFMAAIDQTIVATALPAMAASLGNVQRISWVVVGYLIGATISAPLFGRLGDALGRKRMLLAGLALFVGASVLCALAPNVLLLSAARVLQGFGGGAQLTLCQALVGEAVPPRARGRYQGYLSTIFVSASMFGPVMGGYLTQSFGWRSVFLVNLPLGAAAAVLALRLPTTATGGGRLHFDALGTLLFALFVVPTVLALEQVQRFDPRTLPWIAGLLALAAASVWLLLKQEARAPQPLLPLKLFRQAGIWRTDLMAFFIGATIVSLVSFLPIYLEVVRGTTPAHTGLLLLPLTAGIGIGSLFTGRLVTASQRTAIFPSIGLPVATVTLAAVALSLGAIGTGQLPWAFAVVSLSLGTGMPVVQVITQVVAGPKLLGTAAASVQFSRSVGAAFGTAIVGATLFATLAARDPQVAHVFTDLVERGPVTLAGLDAARRTLAQAEIAEAFRYAFLMVAAYCACAVGLAWWIPVRRL